MIEKIQMKGIDVSLNKLYPVNPRSELNLKKNYAFKKIVASIKSIGLIEPLYIYPDQDKYAILDGYLRFKACELLNIKSVPCLIHDEPEAYTFNRMVNPLGNYQEQMMLRKAVTEIDEKTIAETFGMRTIEHRLSRHLIQKLHPDVVKAYQSETINRQRAKDFTVVVPARQKEILNLMKEANDYSKKFLNIHLLQTHHQQRIATFKQRVLWAKNSEKRKELVNRLKDAQKQQSFYVTHYRDYCSNIMRLVPFIRQFISEPEIEKYLSQNHEAIFEYFNSVISEEKN